MATVWDIVLENSRLSVDPSNTFWDHLNNQIPKIQPILYGEIDIALQSDGISAKLDLSDINVILQED